MTGSRRAQRSDRPVKSGIGIVGIDHVQLAMPAGGEDVARALYGELLGFSEIAKPAALAARGGCWFVAPATHLQVGVEEDFRPARKAHVALVIPDVGKARGRLEAAGVRTVDDRANIGVGRFSQTILSATDSNSSRRWIAASRRTTSKSGPTRLADRV